MRSARRPMWSGASTLYPWGKRTHREQLTYDVEDKHPEINVVRGDSDTTFQLKDRSLLYRGHLEMRSDQKNFYYSYQHELLENGRLIRQKRWQYAIPRDHQ